MNWNESVYEWAIEKRKNSSRLQWIFRKYHEFHRKRIIIFYFIWNLVDWFLYSYSKNSSFELWVVILNHHYIQRNWNFLNSAIKDVNLCSICCLFRIEVDENPWVVIDIIIRFEKRTVFRLHVIDVVKTIRADFDL